MVLELTIFITTNIQVILNLRNMSVYILSVNVIYCLFTDEAHTIYLLWKKIFPEIDKLIHVDCEQSLKERR